jgi:hypothetical protein
MNFRSTFGRLATALVNENKPDSAKKVMDFCLNKVSNEKVSYGFTVIPYISNYFRIGENDKAHKHLQILMDNMNQEMDYYAGLGELSAQFTDDIQRNMYIIKRLADITKQAGQQELYDNIVKDFNRHVDNLERNAQMIK